MCGLLIVIAQLFLHQHDLSYIYMLMCLNLFLTPVFRRKLFWTDRGSDTGIPPKVGSSDMDGGNLTVLYTGNMANIGFITADISARKLYWGVAGTGVVCYANKNKNKVTLYLKDFVGSTTVSLSRPRFMILFQQLDFFPCRSRVAPWMDTSGQQWSVACPIRGA